MLAMAEQIYLIYLFFKKELNRQAKITLMYTYILKKFRNISKHAAPF